MAKLRIEVAESCGATSEYQSTYPEGRYKAALQQCKLLQSTRCGRISQDLPERTFAGGGRVVPCAASLAISSKQASLSSSSDFAEHSRIASAVTWALITADAVKSPNPASLYPTSFLGTRARINPYGLHRELHTHATGANAEEDLKELSAYCPRVLSRSSKLRQETVDRV
jgi:hypothetical protein